MNKFELFACGQILHSWPDDLSFKEIISLCNEEEALDAFNYQMEALDKEDQQITVCERYEDTSWGNIGSLIEELEWDARRNFGGKNE